METLIVSTEDKLEEKIRKIFNESVIPTISSAVAKANAKEWLTKDDLMEMTGWSSRSIQNLRDTKQIPYAKHGRKILYPRKGIVEFLEAHHIKPQK